MKSVHFSTTNIMYSPLPWSPSPDASTSSLPPSPSIDTLPAQEILESNIKPSQPQDFAESIPPPLVYTPWLNSTRLPPQDLFPVGFPSTHIHVLLSFSPATPPNIRYDFVQPPHILAAQLKPSFLDPATSPPLAHMELRCRHLAQRPIAVLPSPEGSGVVSVLDVLAAVYSSLRVPVRHEEYAALSAGDGDGGREARRRVDVAYFRRCGLDAHGAEAKKGVRWVDVLGGKTQFMGLSGPLQAAHVWELHVSES